MSTLNGFSPQPKPEKKEKPKNPIAKVSSKKKFRCSDGEMVSQQQINARLTQAYKMARPLGICECCGLNPATEHDHTLSKQKCKENGMTELIHDESNWSNSCRGCHIEWGHLSKAMEEHKNFVPRMLFLKQVDREEFEKRKAKVSNYLVLEAIG